MLIKYLNGSDSSNMEKIKKKLANGRLVYSNPSSGKKFGLKRHLMLGSYGYG